MADRTMFRGDSMALFFQVVRDLASQQIFTAPTPGIPPPNSVPVNLTGYQLWFTAKKHSLDPDSQAVAQLDNMSIGGIVITLAVNGTGTATMQPAATFNFPDGPVRLLYDLQAKDPTGLVTTIESGTLTVVPDTTRRTS
jgi:hypothetical protein